MPDPSAASLINLCILLPAEEFSSKIWKFQSLIVSLPPNIKRWKSMCTLSVKMDDKVIDRVKPLFGGDKAMNRWIEAVLHKALE